MWEIVFTGVFYFYDITCALLVPLAEALPLLLLPLKGPVHRLLALSAYAFPRQILSDAYAQFLVDSAFLLRILFGGDLLE